MRRVVAAGATDVGQVRSGNEDALLVGDSVFAVADGMGGHLAGEVASATALEPVAALEGQVFDDAAAAVAALRDAVVVANRTVVELAREDPRYRGMGTTLTAVLVEGRRLHLAHVGDSRAYLLRSGRLRQLTDDHTLVQHLVDEGQITREQAATHPQRSIITRAIGVSPEVEVDAISFDLAPGDQVLLCSDGLTGVLDDDTIARSLTAGDDPEATVGQLIDQANAGGGHDNITVLLLRYEDPDAAASAKPETTTETPPRAWETISISTRDERHESDWAGDLGRLGRLSRGGPTDLSEPAGRRAGSILGRAVAIVLALTLLAGLVGGGGQFLLSRSFFVGLDGDQVVIYRGLDASIGPLDLSRVVERTDLTLGDVPAWYHPALEAGRPAADLADARRIANGVPRRDATDPAAPDDTDDQTQDPGAAPAP